MKARLWINHLLNHQTWSRTDIDWEAVDEIDEKLNELDKLKRENYGLKQTIANYKEKEENTILIKIGDEMKIQQYLSKNQYVASLDSATFKRLCDKEITKKQALREFKEHNKIEDEIEMNEFINWLASLGWTL